MIAGTISRPTDTELHAHAIVAGVCQGKHGIPVGAKAEFILQPGLRSVFEAVVDMVALDLPITHDTLRRACSETGRDISEDLLHDLFYVDVPGTWPDHHVRKLREAWTDNRRSEVKVEIENALRRDAIEEAESLIRELQQLEAPDNDLFSGVPVSDIWEAADDDVEWLVKDVISVDQPTIFGAKQKSLKTTLLTDLTVALASGFPWLRRFEIPTKRRVLLFTGEASQKAAVRKIRRAAAARNLQPEDIGDNIRIETANFPNLPSLEDCVAINRAIEAGGIDVVVVDPLYMGLSGVNTANLTEVGPAMRQFMQYCRPANVIIAHHVKKSASFDDAPNLEDLSQAGIAEFAGNYWLMGRMGEYQGDGQHQLAIRYGGRDEQFGLLKLDFDEKAWSAEFTNLVDHRAHEQQRRENAKVVSMKEKILKELGRYPDGISEAGLANAISTKPGRATFRDALTELEEREAIVCLPEFMSSNRRTCKGWKSGAES